MPAPRHTADIYMGRKRAAGVAGGARGLLPALIGSALGPLPPGPLETDCLRRAC